MSIGKYLTNAGVIGALLGALGAARQAQQLPRDWRRILVWVVWAAGLTLALASVAKQQDDEEFARQLGISAREQRAASRTRRRDRI